MVTRRNFLKSALIGAAGLSVPLIAMPAGITDISFSERQDRYSGDLAIDIQCFKEGERYRHAGFCLNDFEHREKTKARLLEWAYSL